MTPVRIDTTEALTAHTEQASQDATASEISEPGSTPTAPAKEDEAAKPTPAKQRTGPTSGTDKKVNATKGKKSGKKPSQEKPSEAKQDTGASDLQQRLLAMPKVDHVVVRREHVAPELLAAIDSANLGSPQVLPSALATMLAVMTACAGPNIKFQETTTDQRIHLEAGLSIRAVLMAPDSQSAAVAPAVLAAAYGAEADAIDEWQATADLETEQRHAAARLQRLFEQVRTNAMLLGSAPPVPPPAAPICRAGPRPRLVLHNQASAAVLAAAAAGGGLLFISDRGIPSMPGVGHNFDAETGNLVNSLGAGAEVAVADPTTGHTVMRALPLSVIGMLTLADWHSLGKATQSQLSATIFAPAAHHPIVSDASELTALCKRLRSLTSMQVNLRLSDKAQQFLASAAVEWTALQRASMEPLSDYCKGLCDLARRIAAVTHLAAAAATEKALDSEIALGAIKHAVALVNTFVIPTALNALKRTSVMQVERDAMRIVSHLRATTSLDYRLFERRTLLRAWQRSMAVAALDKAIGLLVRVGLLMPLDKTDGGKGGQRFEVALAVYGGV